MAALRHPNICAFYGICYSPPCILTGGWQAQGRRTCRLTRWGGRNHATSRRVIPELPAQHHLSYCRVLLRQLSHCTAPTDCTGPHHPPAAEYCSNGSLHELLARARREPKLAVQLTWGRRLALALDAALGML